MSWGTEFVELDKKAHDRESFDCGKEALNTFIRTMAAKHMSAGISRTMLLPSEKALPNNKYAICAFYTIAASTIKKETLPGKVQKKLPMYPVPVFLIAQLAVHGEFAGRGLGKVTLVKALEHLLDANEHMRAYAVIVDCLDDEAERFYLKYGFEFLCEYNGRRRLYIPMNTVKQLF